MDLYCNSISLNNNLNSTLIELYDSLISEILELMASLDALSELFNSFFDLCISKRQDLILSLRLVLACKEKFLLRLI